MMSLACAIGASYNPPPGPYIDPNPEAFQSSRHFLESEPKVFTPYFYWYDVWSGAHIKNPDGTDALTTHPPTLTGFSYKSEAWHKVQLEDMVEAGIDICLPVYWGAPSELAERGNEHWSYAGLRKLVEAREGLLAEGKQPPGIGLFYDTTTLQYNAWNRHVDLTTLEGKQWFYESVRDFFSLIPLQHWALIDGKGIVFLYSASFAKAYDASSFDYVRSRFREDFAGRELYIVKEVSWGVEADATYAWGGALGAKVHDVVSLGPGYDHSAVPGREPLIAEREGGEFFKENWERALRVQPNGVFVETWNEFHEGTDIAHSLEYGRRYIELNKEYVKLYKQGYIPPRPEGPYSDHRKIFIQLKEENATEGLEWVEWEDGQTKTMSNSGKEGRVTVETEHGGEYMYFKIHDSFKETGSMNVRVRVEYLDMGALEFTVQYDGNDPNAPFSGAYTGSEKTLLGTGTEEWRTADFELRDARFLNSQNGGADFRLAVLNGSLAVHRVSVVKETDDPEDGAHGVEAPYIDLERVKGGRVNVAVYGQNGLQYLVQTSIDLSQWINIASLTLTNSPGYLDDLRITNEESRFFRVIWSQASGEQ